MLLWVMRPGVVLGLGAVIVGVGLHVLAPASSAAPAQQSNMTVQASDFAFAAPDTVEAGYVTLDFSNAGAETHHAALERLPGTLSADAFTAALQGDERAALAMVESAGGVAAIDPGQAGEAVVNLQAGTYMLICVIPSPRDRVPHVLKGMIRPLVVTPASTVAAAPAASGEITLRDFQFQMPDVVPAGPVTYHVTNAGPGNPHEFAIVKLNPGVTIDDVRNAIVTPSGPPPFKAVGGFQAISPNGDGYVNLNLEPGEYAAICRVTEPNSGLSHVHLGMIKGFTVQ